MPKLIRDKRVTTVGPKKREAILGAKRTFGDLKYSVSIASSKGGGRQEVFATSPIRAAQFAMINRFTLKGQFPRNASIVVTDSRGRRTNF